MEQQIFKYVPRFKLNITVNYNYPVDQVCYHIELLKP